MYVCIEKYFGIDAVKLLDKYGEHPKRNEDDKIYCSTGSLGMGITVATGRFANKDINVYCLISDGECAEGSVWEALRFIKERKLTNLHIYVNANGWAAYDKVDLDYLEKRLKSFLPRINFIKTSVEWYGLSDKVLTTPIFLLNSMKRHLKNYEKKFADILLNEMKKNENIVVLIGDVGFGVFDKLKSEFPERVINPGSSEQLIVGMAVGLSLEGKIPIIYSITPLFYTDLNLLEIM